MFMTRHLEEKIFLSIVAAIRMADIKGGKYYSRDCRDKADSNFLSEGTTRNSKDGFLSHARL